jgi:type VI secretion system protein
MTARFVRLPFASPARWLLISVVLFCAACSLFSKSPSPVKPAWQSIVVAADEDANANSPVAIDIVLALDQTMVESLLATSASKWFATKGDIQRMFAKSIIVFSYEIVPRQSVKLDHQALSANKILGAFVFADYSTPGDHRQRLALNSNGYVLQLESLDFRAFEGQVIRSFFGQAEKAVAGQVK